MWTVEYQTKDPSAAPGWQPSLVMEDVPQGVPLAVALVLVRKQISTWLGDPCISRGLICNMLVYRVRELETGRTVVVGKL